MADPFDLETPYVPVPILFEAADMISYVMEDKPVIARRIDANFDLLLDIDTREPIGFQLYGASRVFK